MSGIEGKKGYYLQKTGARVNELLERHYIVPTFTTSPTEDTLSWDDDGHIVYFRVGEIIRVKTPEGYDFYRVNDIKDNKINWVKNDTPSDTYTKDEIDLKFFTKEDASGYISEKLVNYYSKREVDGKIEQTNKSVLEQTERVDNLGVELKNKASAEQVNKLESGLETAKRSIAEQTTKVTALQSEIKTKASTQSVTQLGDSVNIISDTVAEQTIRTDELEASIETKVSQEIFDATTGDINSEFIAVKQTTDAIETAVKSQSGEITAINESVNGLSISLGTIESELDSLRNQMDGTTESYFEKWIPTNENEPAKTWIKEGKEEEHKGDTFTNTSLDGEGAGKSWRWLQDDNGNWGWQPIADTDALKALEAAAKAQAAADGKVTIYYEQPSNYKEGDIWFVHNNSYSPYKQGEILSAKTENTLFSLSDWESKTRYTQAVEDLNNVMTTTFKDGVLTEAERISIIESITSIANEQAAVQARYNIIIINANLTDESLKNEFKATKVAYDAVCNSLINIVEQIADAKTENLESLFDSYTQLSDDYSEAYAAHNKKESEINNALMGRLNPANVYIDNITDDGILTPIEKEQLFEIYRNIAREYDATRSNALNYKVWKYSNDGVTEESGLNGGEGKYNNYIAFKSAYNNVASVFSSSIWGFTQMKEPTTLPEGYTTTLLKEYLDTYYEAYGILTESFSAITAAIEDAQKAAEETLQGLTDNLRPEEMSTIVGKGVVLSTIIATKDVNGNITAGMNASSAHSNPEHGRVVFVGGAKDISDFNNAPYVVYEDGHVKMESADIAAYASRVEMYTSLASKADVSSFNEVVDAVNTLKNMWRFEDVGGTLVLKSEYDVVTNGQFAAAAVGTEGGGSVGAAYLSDLYDVSLRSLLSGDILSWNGSEWVNIKQSSLVPDLSGYLPLSGGTITGSLILNSPNSDYALHFQTGLGAGWIGFQANSERWFVTNRNWSADYTLLHSGNYSDYALPRSGGTISGSLQIGNDDNTAYNYLRLVREGYEMSVNCNAYGGYISYGAIGAANAQLRLVSDSITFNGNTLIHSGNYSDYALPLSGGTISYNADWGLKLSSLSGSSNYLWFEGIVGGSTNLLGALGMGSYNGPVCVSPTGVSNTLLHAGNYSQYALPLSGGILSDSWSGGTEIRRSDVNNGYASLIFSQADGTILGRFGFGGVDNPLFITQSGAYNTLIHSGNIGSQSVAYASNAGTLSGVSLNNGSNTPWGTIPMITEYGWMDVGRQFEFHYDNTTGSDYSTVLRCAGNYGNSVILPSASGTLALTTDNVASADVVAKTYANENINYNGNESRIRLISGYASNSEDLGFPARYVSGISVLTNYTGWQMVSFCSSAVPNPYYRAFYDNGARSDWRQLAFLDDNVASATKLETPRTIWGQSFDGTGNVSGNLLMDGWITTPNGTPAILPANDYLVLGQGLASAGKNTYLDGYEVKLRYGTSSTIGLTLNPSGNVTIGSSDFASTLAKLYVNGKVAAHSVRTEELRLGYTHADGDPYLYNWYYSSIGFEYEDQSPSTLKPAIVFKTMNLTYAEDSGEERMRITAGGNVLVGTTNDKLIGKLQINGNVVIGNSSDSEIYMCRPYINRFCAAEAGGSFAWRVDGSDVDIMSLSTSGILTANNGIVTNEITIGGIKLDVYNGALRVNGDIFSTGQFAASVAGEATGGSNLILDYASIVNALGYTPANNNNLAQVAFTGSYSSLSGTPDVYTKADVYNKNEINQKLAGVGGGGGSIGSTFGIDYINGQVINGQVFNMPNGVNCITSYSEATVDFSSIVPADPSLPCIIYIVKCDYHTLQVTSGCNIVSVNSSGDEVIDFSINGMTGMMLVWEPDYWRWFAYLQK